MLIRKLETIKAIEATRMTSSMLFMSSISVRIEWKEIKIKVKTVFMIGLNFPRGQIYLIRAIIAGAIVHHLCWNVLNLNDDSDGSL